MQQFSQTSSIRNCILQRNLLQQRRGLFSLSRIARGSKKYDEYEGKLHPGMFEDQSPGLWEDDDTWCPITERIKQNQTYACWEYVDNHPLRMCTVTSQELVDNGLHVRDLLALVLTPLEVTHEFVKEADPRRKKKMEKMKKSERRQTDKVTQVVEEEIIEAACHGEPSKYEKMLQQSMEDVGHEVFRRPRPCILLRSGSVLMVFHHFKVVITDDRLLFFDVYERVLLSAMKRICRSLDRLAKITDAPSEFRLRCVEEILQEVCSHESRKLVIMRASVDAVLQKIRNASAAELEQGELIVLGPLNDAVDFFDKTLDDAVAVFCHFQK